MIDREAAIKKEKEMITTLTALIRDGQLTLLGRTYQVGVIGKHTIQLTGPRGAGYILTPCPNAKIIGHDSLPVYSLMSRRGLKQNLFTIKDDNPTPLERL